MRRKPTRGPEFLVNIHTYTRKKVTRCLVAEKPVLPEQENEMIRHIEYNFASLTTDLIIINRSCWIYSCFGFLVPYLERLVSRFATPP